VGATGERQPDQPGNFVEGFTCSIVERGTQRIHLTATHQHQGRVPAGHQESDEGIGQFPMLQFVHGHVRREVVDAVDIHPEPRREALRSGNSNKE